MSTFFPGYQDTFKGTDGKTYGIAKDGNTIAMAYNTDLVETPPTTLDDLITATTALKDNDRSAGADVPQPGSRSRSRIHLCAGRRAAQRRQHGRGNLNGRLQGSRPVVHGPVQERPRHLRHRQASSCGEQLGKGDVAIVFEGGWLKGGMDATYPDINWAFAEMPQGSIGAPMTISYTAAYGIGADSANPDQGWTALQYLTGPDGMQLWTEGGIAVPSRSDVPVPEGFEAIVAGARRTHGPALASCLITPTS